MEIIKTEIDGVYIIEPRIFNDARGYFFESFSQRDFDAKVRHIDFVQDNESKSSYGVMRGLHFQRPPYSQSKLVRCVRGGVLDVAVDIRKGSPTYGKYVAVELTEDNHRQFFIPRGFAHGFSVLSDTAVFLYKWITSIIQKQTVVLAFLTTVLALIGRFQQNMQYCLKRILSTSY